MDANSSHLPRGAGAVEKSLHYAYRARRVEKSASSGAFGASASHAWRW